ncbi:tyrosine-type recombinase/integrase [Glutamicibacter sp.]|uniref:tyrosine-type recombinase/integrase n=1 Tax=Glutamicibacter sp. TaxID=1931995 RepID=UPI002FDFE67E
MASLDTYTSRKNVTKYRVRWYSDHDLLSQSFDTEKDALRWKAIIEAAKGDTTKATEALLNELDTGPTVQKLLRHHIDQLTNVGEYQLKRYRGSIDLHFSDELGTIKVARVNSEHIVAWMRMMQGKGLSAKTIANHRGLLSAAFDTAIRQRIITVNPCAGVRLPKDDRIVEPMRIIPMEQFITMVDNMKKHYRPVTKMMLYTGLRFGEITALQKEDFTTLGATSVVRVTKAWKEDGNHRFFLGPPKTPKARRTVSLPRPAVELMAPILERLSDGEQVFKTVQGRQIRSSGYHKVWKPAWEKLRVEKINRPRPHDIRHTHASMMLANGMDMYELSRRLGHESVKTTVDRYSHLVEGAHARGASIADSAFG